MRVDWSQVALVGTAVVAILDVVLPVAALVVVPRDRRPSAALAWLVVVNFVPVIGALVFLVIGSPKLPRSRRDKQRSMDQRIAERSRDLAPVSADHPTPPWLGSVTRLNQTVGAMPLLENNTGRLMPRFDEQLAAMVESIDNARRYVHVGSYILSLDTSTAPFFDALARAVSRGVDVKVLLDHLGSRSYPGYRATKQELDRIGAHWQLMLPVQPWRGRYQRPDSDELLATSREQMLDRDPSKRLLCQVAPSGPGFEVENNLVLFNTLVYYAQRRLSITSPYFVPDESLLSALTTAARRGVDVELFVSEIGDQFFVYHAQHSYYQTLLEAGVRIYLYPAPSILHAKHMSVDELVTVVGSSNMDIRSFALDLELSLMTCEQEFGDQLRAVDDEYRAISRELTLTEWSHRSFSHRLVDDLTRLTSAVQ